MSKQTNVLRNAIIALIAAVSLSLPMVSAAHAESGVTSPPGPAYGTMRPSVYWSGGNPWMPRELKPVRGRYFHGDNGG